MIELDDLKRPCRVQVLDEDRRSWRRCFLRRPIYRTVFAGYINNWTVESHVSGPSSMTMTVKDATSLLQYITETP